MKEITILWLFLLMLPDKQIRTIRIIHGGEELKPTGTLLISPDTLMYPTDRPTDKMFGRGIKTDDKTFDYLESYIAHSKYLINVAQLRSSGTNEYYKIIDTDKEALYISGGNFTPFFSDLRSHLNKNKLDVQVVEALRYY